MSSVRRYSLADGDSDLEMNRVHDYYDEERGSDEELIGDSDDDELIQQTLLRKDMDELKQLEKFKFSDKKSIIAMILTAILFFIALYFVINSFLHKKKPPAKNHDRQHIAHHSPPNFSRLRFTDGSDPFYGLKIPPIPADRNDERFAARPQSLKDADAMFLADLDCKNSMECSKTYSKIGIDLMNIGDYVTAMRKFNEAWLIDGNNHETYWGMGIVLAKKKEFEKSVALMEKSIMVSEMFDHINSPKDEATLHCDAGTTYMALLDNSYISRDNLSHDLSESINLKDIDTTRKMKYTFEENIINFKIQLKKDKKVRYLFDKAMEYFQDCQDLDSKNPLSYYNLAYGGYLLDNGGQGDENYYMMKSKYAEFLEVNREMHDHLNRVKALLT